MTLHSLQELGLFQECYKTAYKFDLLVLVDKFKKGDSEEKSRIYRIYLNHMRYINNWDLIDSSAGQIVGAYLEHKDKKPLYGMAKSYNLWERRIAIMSTFHMIKNGNFDDALKISLLLIHDSEDLIHKAVGWMLR